MVRVLDGPPIATGTSRTLEVPVVVPVLITVLLRSGHRCSLDHPCAGHEPLNRLAAVSWGEVSIALNHCQTFPSAEILDREEIHGLHRQPRGEGVSEVMEAEIVNLGGAHGCEEGLFRPPEVTRPDGVGEHER